MLLHDQRNGASQHRGTIGWHDAGERVRERSLCHDVRDDGTYPVPRAGDFPDDHDDFRRQPGDQPGETDPEKARRAIQRLGREPIVLRGQPQQLDEAEGRRRALRALAGRPAGGRQRLPPPRDARRVILLGGRIRRVAFPAAAASAAAQRPGLVDADMAELAGSRVAAVNASR
jgi:hypothetical protein